MSHYDAVPKRDPIKDMTTNPVGIAKHPYARHYAAPVHAISSGQYRLPYRLNQYPSYRGCDGCLGAAGGRGKFPLSTLLLGAGALALSYFFFKPNRRR